MVGTMEGRGTFDFKAFQSRKDPEPRLKSSPNVFMTSLYKVGALAG